MRLIKFKVIDTRGGQEKLIGYEQLNNQGQWERKRPEDAEWELGTFTYRRGLRTTIRRQYSGFDTANGDYSKEIYEGDEITGQIGREEYYGTVVFDEGCFSLVIERICSVRRGYDKGNKPPLCDFDKLF